MPVPPPPEPVFADAGTPEALTTLRVAKNGQRARVQLTAGEALVGDFFVAAKARSRLDSETLMDVLNDPARTFVPFRREADGGLLVLNKHYIVVVEFDDDELEQAFDPNFDEPSTVQEVCLRYRDGQTELRGFAYAGDLHPFERRLTDLLNHDSQFLLMRIGERMALVNKQLMHFAVAQPPETR